jgi:hypothetical protein
VGTKEQQATTQIWHYQLKKDSHLSQQLSSIEVQITLAGSAEEVLAKALIMEIIMSIIRMELLVESTQGHRLMQGFKDL